MKINHKTWATVIVVIGMLSACAALNRDADPNQVAWPDEVSAELEAAVDAACRTAIGETDRWGINLSELPDQLGTPAVTSARGD